MGPKVSVVSSSDSCNFQHHCTMATLFPGSSSAHSPQPRQSPLDQSALPANPSGSFSTRAFSLGNQQSPDVGEWAEWRKKIPEGLASTSVRGMSGSKHLQEGLKSDFLSLSTVLVQLLIMYYHLGTSTDQVTTSALPETINLPQLRDDALNTQGCISGVIEEGCLSLELSLNHIEPLIWTKKQELGIVATEVLHSNWVAIEAISGTSRSASTSRKAVGYVDIRSITSELTAVQSSHLTCQLKPTSHGAGQCCQQSFSGSIADPSQPCELARLSAVVVNETPRMPDYAHSGIFEALSHLHACKQTVASVISTATSPQLSITVPTSWSSPKSSHSNYLATATGSLPAGAPSMLRATFTGPSWTGISTSTCTHCAQTSFDAAQIIQNTTSIPIPTTATTHSPTAVDQVVPSIQSNTMDPPELWPTLSTRTINVPGGSTSIATVQTTPLSFDVHSFLRLSRSIPKRSLGISLGTASSAFVIVICIFLFHRPCYLWVRERRKGHIVIGHQLESTEDIHIDLLPYRTHNPEISHFSVDS